MNYHQKRDYVRDVVQTVYIIDTCVHFTHTPEIEHFARTGEFTIRGPICKHC